MKQLPASITALVEAFLLVLSTERVMHQLLISNRKKRGLLTEVGVEQSMPFVLCGGHFGP